jgi:hypothetical protein
MSLQTGIVALHHRTFKVNRSNSSSNLTCFPDQVSKEFPGDVSFRADFCCFFSANGELLDVSFEANTEGVRRIFESTANFGGDPGCVDVRVIYRGKLG